MGAFKTTTLYMIPLLLLVVYASGITDGDEHLDTECQSSFWLKRPVIGIDLGTTYSRVGLFKSPLFYADGEFEIIPDDQGNRTTPSWVAFTDTGRPLVGEAAMNQAVERTVFDVKRLIGRKFDDPELQKHINMLPYKVVNKDGKPFIEVETRDGEAEIFSPEGITAIILQKMKLIAESYMGKNITNAVITVPVYFNEEQRLATKIAGAIAGFNMACVINEPTATAIAYDLINKYKGITKTVLVLDLGGGTFDATILIINNGDIKVLATSSDTHLGGKDFDNRVMDYFVNLIKKTHNKDISQDKEALGKLRKECERAKCALSSQHQVRVEIQSLFNDKDFKEDLTRARFEELNVDLFRRTMGPIEQALKDAGLEKSEVHDIVLVGGSTRIPKVQEMWRNYFGGKEPMRGVNPDETATHGVAAIGWSISNDYLWSFSAIEMSGLSLGIETAGGIMTKLIPKETMIPTERSQVFSTYQDNQTTVSIKVYEGERALTRDCREFGSFVLSGIPAAPRGVPQIEVTFHIDVNRILHVTAQDKASNKSASINFPNGPRQTKYYLTNGNEAAEKIREAVVFAVEDRNVKEKIKARSNLEAFNMIESEDKKMTEDTLREANEWLDRRNQKNAVKDNTVCSQIVKGCAGSSDGEKEEDSKDEL